MVQLGTILKVVDKTGVMFVQCIKVLGSGSKRIACLGDVILVSVQRINVKKFHKVKLIKKRRFRKGTLHRALILRSKVNYCRMYGVYIRFNENSVAIVNKNAVPVSKRVFGPVLRELCMRIPSLGCVSRFII